MKTIKLALMAAIIVIGQTFVIANTHAAAPEVETDIDFEGCLVALKILVAGVKAVEEVQNQVLVSEDNLRVVRIYSEQEPGSALLICSRHENESAFVTIVTD